MYSFSVSNSLVRVRSQCDHDHRTMIRSQLHLQHGNWCTEDSSRNGKCSAETSDHDHSGKTQQSTDHDRSIIDAVLLAISWKTENRDHGPSSVGIYTFDRVAIKS